MKPLALCFAALAPMLMLPAVSTPPNTITLTVPAGWIVENGKPVSGWLELGQVYSVHSDGTATTETQALSFISMRALSNASTSTLGLLSRSALKITMSDGTTRTLRFVESRAR